MNYRLVLGAPTEEFARQATTLIEESGGATLVGTATTDGGVLAILAEEEVDVVLLHERLGPLPVLDLARSISGRFPDTGMVLMVRDQTPEILRAALHSGVRDVIHLPLSLEEMQNAVTGTGRWSQAIRTRLANTLTEGAHTSGKMVAVGGAKGGVGATTIAVHLALEAQLASPGTTVCLVDFDLQAGDVRAYLDLTHRRSVTDLVEVADDITARHLEDSLYAHPTGLRILLPPQDGERGEELTAGIARKVLGAVKSRFDIVIVDVGTIVTEASAVASEMANQVVVVVTPDVPALRSANRLLSLWERLQVRNDGIGIVVNRGSKESEVQHDLVGRVTNAPVLVTVIPSDFRALENAANTGVPDRLEEGQLRRAARSLAVELALVPVQTSTNGQRRVGRKLSGDRGQSAVETMGMAFIIGLLIMALWQMVLIGFTFVLAGNSAREASRQLAVNGPVHDAASNALPRGWRPSMRLSTSGNQATVTLAVPIVVPRWRSPIDISISAGTVLETLGGSSFETAVGGFTHETVPADGAQEVTWA